MVLFLHIKAGVFDYLMCKIRISVLATRNPESQDSERAD